MGKNIMKNGNLIRLIRAIILVLVFCVGVGYLFAAWTPAPANPPSGNVATPINTSNTFQSKGGGTASGAELFNVNGGLAIGDTGTTGSLGVFGPVTIHDTLTVSSLAGNAGSSICAQSDGTITTVGCNNSMPGNNIEISTALPSAINRNTATCGGEVTSQGNHPPVTRGVVWSTLSNPTVSLSTKTVNGTGLGTFVSSITGLQASTHYYVRAYATDTQGTTKYGGQEEFTTTSTQWTAPTLATTAVTGITGSTAITGGSFTGGSGVTVVDKGIQKSEDNITFSNVTPSSGSGMTTFTTNLSGLTINTTYWVRAYAITNIAGTIYGTPVRSFTTTGGSTCGGYKPAPGNFGSEYCWYVAGLGQSCTTFCASRGSSCNPNGNWNDSSTCEISKHFYPSASCGTGPWYRYGAPEFTWNNDAEIRNSSTSLSCSALPMTGERKRLCACME